MLVCLLDLHQAQLGTVALSLSLRWAILTPCLVCLLVVLLPSWVVRHLVSRRQWATHHLSRDDVFKDCLEVRLCKHRLAGRHLGLFA
jgi:hypothetical protein